MSHRDCHLKLKRSATEGSGELKVEVERPTEVGVTDINKRQSYVSTGVT